MLALFLNFFVIGVRIKGFLTEVWALEHDISKRSWRIRWLTDLPLKVVIAMFIIYFYELVLYKVERVFKFLSSS